MSESISKSSRGKVLLRARDLKVCYGKTLALNTSRLEVEGTIIAVIGHNGSGKSTLIKTLLDLLVPRKGSIEAYWLGEKEPLKLKPSQHMAFSPEHGAVFEDMPVESYIQLWCRIKFGRGNYYRREGSSTIELLNIAPLFRKLGRELSKGQRRRVQSAVGFLIRPKLFLFDEPFDGLDIMQSAELAGVMLEEAKNMSMIVSSHRMDVVERIADVVIVLRDGEVFSSGSVDEVCSMLCGGSILVSSKDPQQQVPLSNLLPVMQREFENCLVNQVGQQLIVTGNEANLEALKLFFERQRLSGVKLDSVRPSLLDAMRYHMAKLH